MLSNIPYEVTFLSRVAGSEMVFPLHMVGTRALFGSGRAVGAHGGDFLRRAEYVTLRFLGAGDFRHSCDTRSSPAGAVVHQQLFSETKLGDTRVAAPVRRAQRLALVRDFKLLRAGHDVPKP